MVRRSPIRICRDSRTTLLRVASMSVLYAGALAATKAVSCASFNINERETVGLIGESGCGKSTLARAIVGLLPSSARREGSILFRGQELICATEAELQRVRGAHIALISQDPAQALNPVLSIGVQIAEVLRSHTTLSRSEVKSRVGETLASVGFDDPEAISRRFPNQLSGGQRQRAAIAQAIACRPALLVADEATAKLDAHLKTELLELFESLRTRYGTAFLLITHEPAVAAVFCERLLVMYAGEIVESAPKVSILRQPLHPYTQALIELARERCATGHELSRDRFTAIEGEPQFPGRHNQCCFERRCGQRMPECASRHPITTHRDGHEVVCLKYE